MNQLNSTVDCLQSDGGVEHLDDVWTVIGEEHNERAIPKKAFNVNYITQKICKNN